MEHKIIIKKILSELSLSQVKLAEELEISSKKINHVAAGTNKISGELALKLSQKYGFNFQWILTGEGEMYQNPLIPQITEILAECPIKPDIIFEALKKDPDRMSLASRVVLLDDKEALEKFNKLS